jgi:hypothetical protein
VYSCNVRQRTLFVQGDPDYIARASIAECKAELTRKLFNTKGSLNDLRERLLKKLPAEGVSRKMYQALRIKRQKDLKKENSTAVAKVPIKASKRKNDDNDKQKKVKGPSAKKKKSESKVA